MPELVVEVTRVLPADDATRLIGTSVQQALAPTIKSPADGSNVRLVDTDGGDTLALITRLGPERRQALREAVLPLTYGNNAARNKKGMLWMRNRTFGYAPRNPMVRQEGCRATTLGRDLPDVEAVLEGLADTLSAEFELLMPAQSSSDHDTVASSVLADWRMGERSLWTSGVINQASVLPYHRDGNNLDVWSAMPTLRYGMTGGHLHLPEYGVVFPTGDGDVTWFYGKGLVHGVTDMARRRPDGYRYSVVFYALRGLAHCAAHAEETRLAAERRTIWERAEADKIRARIGLAPEAPYTDATGAPLSSLVGATGRQLTPEPPLP